MRFDTAVEYLLTEGIFLRDEGTGHRKIKRAGWANRVLYAALDALGQPVLRETRRSDWRGYITTNDMASDDWVIAHIDADTGNILNARPNFPVDMNEVKVDGWYLNPSDQLDLYWVAWSAGPGSSHYVDSHEKMGWLLNYLAAGDRIGVRVSCGPPSEEEDQKWREECIRRGLLEAPDVVESLIDEPRREEDESIAVSKEISLDEARKIFPEGTTPEETLGVAEYMDIAGTHSLRQHAPLEPEQPTTPEAKFYRAYTLCKVAVDELSRTTVSADVGARELAMVRTKLDEARLWVAEFLSKTR